MALVEHPMKMLEKFLPNNTFGYVVAYLDAYKVHLKITKKRSSILGDYRHKNNTQNHTISINGNLNQFEFLLTLLHELAHLLAFEKYGNKIDAHGKEWKHTYSQLLKEFIAYNIFPEDILLALQKTIHNPAATTAGEAHLIKILKRYNTSTTSIVNVLLVENLTEGETFITRNGKVFRLGKLRRKRYECVEIATGLKYHISAIAEVKKYNIN